MYLLKYYFKYDYDYNKYDDSKLNYTIVHGVQYLLLINYIIKNIGFYPMVEIPSWSCEPIGTQASDGWARGWRMWTSIRKRTGQMDGPHERLRAR